MYTLFLNLLSSILYFFLNYVLLKCLKSEEVFLLCSNSILSKKILKRNFYSFARQLLIRLKILDGGSTYQKCFPGFSGSAGAGTANLHLLWWSWHHSGSNGTLNLGAASPCRKIRLLLAAFNNRCIVLKTTLSIWLLMNFF